MLFVTRPFDPIVSPRAHSGATVGSLMINVYLGATLQTIVTEEAALSLFPHHSMDRHRLLGLRTS